MAGAILALIAPLLVQAFQLDGQAAEILTFYCRVIAFSYVFFGLHFSATQTLTGIGRPMLATTANLIRDMGLAIPLIFWAHTF